MALGWRSLAEMADGMTSEEFDVWQTFAEAEPFGEYRADVRAAVVAQTIANYSGRVRKDGAGPAELSEFMPFLERQDTTPDPESMFRKMAGK